MNATLSTSRKTVLLASALLFFAWCATHGMALVATQNGLIRFTLTTLFALVTLFRVPTRGRNAPGARRNGAPVLAGAGTILAVLGIVFRVKQAEWVGVLLVLGGSLHWTLPVAYARNVPRALVILYWAHPLPSRVFGALQLTMQQMSVEGSEWLLHVLNVRVWADGMVLHTGLNTFEVPAWCSGMRTATTVFILSLALGLLKRFRPLALVALVIAALGQALLLNILRISAMVAFAPFMEGTAGVEFLHNTAGVLPVLAVVLVVLESSLFLRWHGHRTLRQGDLNPSLDHVFDERPPFWRRVAKRREVVALGIAALVLAGVAAYRTRPEHRAMMIKDVVASLRDTRRFDLALRAADVVRSMVPYDPAWELTSIRILLLQGRYTDVMQAIDRLPAMHPSAEVQKKILLAYSLMGLGRLQDAHAIVRSLPENVQRIDPRVNMILAEIAVYAGDPTAAARSVVVAKNWTPNTSRIQSVYPFLRAYRQWDGIAGSDLGAPFAVAEQALSASEAYMNLNDAPRVANIALAAMREWPTDHRVLEPLFFLAMRRESAWEDRFCLHLRRCLPAVDDPDVLYPLLEKCFRLVRPDLAWDVHRRLESLDPEHPYLALAAARYGNAWFAFRRRHIGIAAPSALSSIDLRAFFRLGLSMKAWRDLCMNVPRGEALALSDVLGARKQYLADARAGFRERAARNALTLPMHYAFVGVLEISGDIPGAREQLRILVERHPDEAAHARLTLSEIYERKADWEQVYETLRGYPWGDENPALMPLLRLLRSQLYLRLGLAALDTAAITAARFPQSAEAARLWAQTLLTHDSPEEALFVLGRPRLRRIRPMDVLEAKALFETERYSTLEAFTRSALLPRYPRPAATAQHLFLPPAELSVLWHRVSIPSTREFDAHAARIQAIADNATSPFLRELMPLWLACHRGEGDWSPDRWKACGRDPVEQATALNQLVLLLCGRDRFGEAEVAARAAAELCPRIGLLWRIWISLSGADADVIRKGRAACPPDPELWLADLATRCRTTRGTNPVDATTTTDVDEATRRQVSGEVADAVRLRTFSPATMIRAGDLLFRIGMRDTACTAAEDGMARARGLLPAYVLGIRCALDEADTRKAMKATKLAIDASLRPPPILYEKLVDLKSIGGEIDTDAEMVEALRNLRVESPDNPRWAQMLGYVRFRRGGWEVIDALFQMSVAIDGGATNKIPFVVAAESSRLLGNTDRAADYLRRALALHPDDIGVMNNLVYTLAFNPRTLPEALEMLPRLLAHADEDSRILDTVALTYLRAERLTDAEPVIRRLLEHSADRSQGWFRARMYQASIALKRNLPNRADEILRSILARSRAIPDEDVLAANRLLSEAQIRKGTGPEGAATPAEAPRPDEMAAPTWRPAENLDDVLKDTEP